MIEFRNGVRLIHRPPPFHKSAGGSPTPSRGDCVARAVSIVTGLPYGYVYECLTDANAAYRGRAARGKDRKARHGVWTRGETFKRQMRAWGFTWRPTMGIGTGCTMHVRQGEVPATGRHVLSLSRHYTALVDGVIHDRADPSRDASRCVYGIWTLEDA